MKWLNLLNSFKPFSTWLTRNRADLLVLTPSFIAGFLIASNVKPNSFMQTIKLTPTLLAKEESKGSNSFGRSFNFIADAVDIAAPSVVRIEVTGGQHFAGYFNSVGSGFIVTEDGVVLSNAHVVKNASSTVTVQLSNGDTYQGVIVDVDPVADLAAIKLIYNKQIKFPHVKLGDSVRAGEWVAALGSPLQLSNTVTAGIVSSLHRGSGELGLKHSMGYIQTDAAINVGNSGGPLINLDGEVIGINCFTVQQANGISFAIPSNIAREFLCEALKKDVKLQKGSQNKTKFYIGIVMLTLTPDILATLQQRSIEHFHNIKGGVLVARVNPGSPSDRCGLLTGDVILAINNEAVTSSQGVYNRVCEGLPMKIKIQRGSAILTRSVSPELCR